MQVLLLHPHVTCDDDGDDDVTSARDDDDDDDVDVDVVYDDVHRNVPME